MKKVDKSWCHSLMSVERWQSGSLNIWLSPSVQSETRLDYSSYEGITAQSRCRQSLCNRNRKRKCWNNVNNCGNTSLQKKKGGKGDEEVIENWSQADWAWSDDLFCVLLQTHIDVLTQFPLQGSTKCFWCWLCWGDFLWRTEKMLQHQRTVSFSLTSPLLRSDWLLTSGSFILLLCAAASSHRWNTFHSGHETNPNQAQQQQQTL